MPQLENRTLDISEDLPGFEYRYWICTKRFLGICTRQELKVEKFDLNDADLRRRLIDMGFVAKVRERQ